MDRILSAASFTRNRLGKEEERWPVLAIQELDLGDISLSSVHVAVSSYLYCTECALIRPGCGLTSPHELHSRPWILASLLI